MSPRRRVARQAGTRLDEAPRHPVRRPALRRVLSAVCVRAGVRLETIARNQPHRGRQIVGVDDEQTAGLVVRVAAPVHAAQIARKDERPADAWRREHAFVPQLRNRAATRFPLLGADGPHVIGR